MKKILFFSFIILSLTSKAQFVVNYKKVADAYFENKDYYAASTFYKKALKITSDSSNIILPYSTKENTSKNEKRVISEYESSIFNLAESSRLYREYEEAEKYYAVAITFPNTRYRKALFYYAESLRANKKYEQAISSFEQFIKKNGNDPFVADAQKEILSCKFALHEMRYPRLVQVKKIQKNINGLGSNYAPVVNNNEFYFTSSRPVSVPGKKDFVKTAAGDVQVATKATPFVNHIYEAKDELSKEAVDVKKVDVNFPKDMEFAAASLNPDGTVMYFTGWKEQGKTTIYVSRKMGDKWSDPEPAGLQINSKDFNSAQPSVTSDGKFLLFSSDRTGGYGKYDIWYCPIRDDGTFGQAINMGPKINTEGDEKSPYYNVKTKRLLFSTDARIGLGGYDFFESIGDLAEWTKPRNMGYPFNSSKDDVYFTAISEDGTYGYISSDRESSCCLEVFEVKVEYISISGIISDCKTKKPLAGATVKMSDLQTEDSVIITDQSGRYDFKIDSKRPVKLHIEKEDYFTINRSYSYEDVAKSDTLMYNDFCLQSFKIDVPIVLDNIYYEFNSAELTDSSKLVLNELVKIMEDNPEMEIELGAHTDSMGTDEYNQELSERRAQSCVNYLITREIAPERLKSKGYGEMVPIALNTLKNGKDNPAGRAKNRRTEFKVTKK